jgi:hypothetical protein
MEVEQPSDDSSDSEEEEVSVVASCSDIAEKT